MRQKNHHHISAETTLELQQFNENQERINGKKKRQNYVSF